MNTSKGLTLLEVMLVLAIASVILILGMSQYQSLQIDQNIKQANYNVDYLFQGLRNYYYANCRGQYNPSSSSYAQYTNYSNGTLNPSQSPPSPFPVSITSSTGLLGLGFISKWPQISSSIIDSTNSNAYVVQFNLIQQSSKTTSGCWNIVPGGLACTTITSETPVRLWTAQVAAKILPAKVSNALAYKAMLLADCVSSLSGSTVTPCATSTGGGGSNNTYLVWTRLPFNASSSKNASLLAPSMAVLKEFTAQYTNDPMYESGSTANAAAQYYLCGG